MIPVWFLSPEIKEFSQVFHDALGGIGEEDGEGLESHVTGSGIRGTSNKDG